MATSPQITSATAPEQAPSFAYGYRYVQRTLSNGQQITEQVPLSLEDVLHPQLGDIVIHSNLHEQLRVDLFNVCREQLIDQPDAVVLSDVLIEWDVPDLRNHAPDIAVIFGVRAHREWSVFKVAEEGVRPALIVEITSPDTRSIDLVDKLEDYADAGVPLYIIIDRVRRRGQVVTRLLGYEQTTTTYRPLAANERGWLWLAPIQVWLSIEESRIACYDQQQQRILGHPELRLALNAAIAAREAAEQRQHDLAAELQRLRNKS